MLDVLIRNAQVIDGSGEPAYTGNVGIRGGRLVVNPDNTEAAEAVDAAGCCLADDRGGSA